MDIEYVQNEKNSIEKMKQIELEREQEYNSQL